MKININDPIFDSIVSLQEYNSDDYETPYVIKLNNEDGEILCIGVEHSIDPLHNNYVVIESLFKDFIKKGKEYTVVLIENFKPEIESKKNMIKKYGESGFLVWLSNKYDVKSICPEPSPNEVMNFVIEKWNFKKEDILLWIFLNMLLYALKSQKTNIVNNADNIINQIKDIGDSIGIKKSFDEYLLYFQNKLNEIFGNGFVFGNKNELLNQEWNIKEIEDIQNPFIKKTIINEIGAAFNSARDAYIALAKIKLFEEGKNIFSVFGKNHVVCQESVLKEFLKRKKL